MILVSNKIKIRAVMPNTHIRKKYNIPAGRPVIWESDKQGIKPILCRLGQVFMDKGRTYQVVQDERYPRVMQAAKEYNKRGEPIELGCHL